MDFLKENAKKEGVNVTSSGLQYKILKSGNGKTPCLTDKVAVHYEGKLTNGTIFDSSFERGTPIEFSINMVIPGWTEALQLMKEGDEWELFIPSELAYKDQGAGDKIGPNETLIFTVHLIEVKEFEPLKVTDRAVEEVKRVLNEQNMPIEQHVLQVGVRGGGCSGFEYSLNFGKREEIKDTDILYNFNGLEVALDKRSQPYLAGTEIGFQDGLQGRGFVFNNPMSKKSCGCGSSFSVDDETPQSNIGGCGSCPSNY